MLGGEDSCDGYYGEKFYLYWYYDGGKVWSGVEVRVLFGVLSEFWEEFGVGE